MTLRESADRLAAGMAWENMVAAALRARGWQVLPYGLGTLDPRAREWLKRDTSSPLRWLPDLVARRDGAVVLVDPKGGGSHTSRAHNVESSSAFALDELSAFSGLPVWIVFRGGWCVTPATVLVDGVEGIPTERGSGTPFLRISVDLCERVDDVFGGLGGGHD